MVKTIISILMFLCLLIPDNSLATLKGSTVAGTEDSCTGGLVASWHMEDLDLANEDGCIDGTIVNGDTVWAATSASLTDTDKSEGTYSLTAPTPNDWVDLEPTTCNIEAEGQVYIDFRIVTLQAYAKLLSIGSTESQDEIRFTVTGSSTNSNIDFYAIHEGNNDPDGLTLDTSIDISSDNTQWFRLKLQWKPGVNGVKAEIWSLDTASPRQVVSSLASSTLSGTATAMVTDPTLIRVGNISSGGAIMFDRLEIYNRSDDL